MKFSQFNPLLLLLILFFATLALSTLSCSDTECTPGKTKCEDNVFYACRDYAWKTVVCEDNAPICDDKRGCLQKDDSSEPSTSTTTCTAGQQMCVANTFYKCVNDVWNIIPCPDTLPVCDDSLGCVAQ